MKLILIAILTALGETMAINGVGFESESGTINKRFQFRDEPEARKPWDSPSSAPPKAPSNKIDWNQEGGTRMFMQNVPVDGPNLDFKQADDTRMFMQNVQVDGPNLDFKQVDDTRMFMQNVQVDGPNLDFNDEQSSKNDVGKEASKSADETGGHELNINREFGVPDTVADWMKILASAHKALPPLIKNMKLAQFWPLKNDFEDGVAEIRRIEGEKGPSSFYLQTIGREFGRADQMAREMCTKNPSVDSGCESHYPKKN